MENPDITDEEIIDKVKVFSSDDEKLKILGELLSNKSSRDIIRLLIEKEMYTNEIANKLEIRPNLVVHHLKKLEGLGLLEITNKEIVKKGNTHRCFRINPYLFLAPGGIQDEERGTLKKIFKKGMKFESKIKCTIGFPATRGTTDGFVTAGHCLDGEQDNDVGQATTSTVIGTVNTELYDAGTNEDCDCGFVALDGSVSLSKKIFGVSVLLFPDHADTASVPDTIRMAGKSSGIMTGDVEAVNTTVDTINPTMTFTGVTKATYNNASGDSGGTVYESSSIDPGFLGIHIVGDTQDGWYVPQATFLSKISNLAWDF